MFYEFDVLMLFFFISKGWEAPDIKLKNVPDLEVGLLRQKLIDATTADKIRECLVNLAVTNPAQPLWTVNPQWKLPTPLHSIVMALPRSFIQVSFTIYNNSIFNIEHYIDVFV